MPNTSPTTWQQNNPYRPQTSCEHCGNLLNHESWCFTRNTAVQYAYQIVMDPSKLTLADHLILHSLGVIWEMKTVQKNCKSTSGMRAAAGSR
jgi:hypothetical protein